MLLIVTFFKKQTKKMLGPPFVTASSVHPPSCHVGLRDRCCCGSSGWKFIFCSLPIIEPSKLTFIRGITSLVCGEGPRGENTSSELALCGMQFQDGPSAGHDDVWSHIFHIRKTLPGYKHQDSSASCFWATWVHQRLRGGWLMLALCSSPRRRTSVSSTTLAGNAS